MLNLALKIKKMVEDNGLVKFENTNIMGKAAEYAVFQGLISVYAHTDGHTIYTVVK